MKRNKKSMSDFKTYALADERKRDPKTNAAIPSDDAVAQAKQWVEHNKK